MKNYSKIISLVLLSFSILLLFYVFYRSQIYHGGSNFNYYLIYYIITFLLIVFSLVSFIIPKKLKINITLCLISAVVSLYLVEGYIIISKKKLLHYNSINKIYKKSTGKDYDKRSQTEVYYDLKKKTPLKLTSNQKY